MDYNVKRHTRTNSLFENWPIDYEPPTQPVQGTAPEQPSPDNTPPPSPPPNLQMESTRGISHEKLSTDSIPPPLIPSNDPDKETENTEISSQLKYPGVDLGINKKGANSTQMSFQRETLTNEDFYAKYHVTGSTPRPTAYNIDVINEPVRHQLISYSDEQNNYGGNPNNRDNNVTDFRLTDVNLLQYNQCKHQKRSDEMMRNNFRKIFGVRKSSGGINNNENVELNKDDVVVNNNKETEKE